MVDVTSVEIMRALADSLRSGKKSPHPDHAPVFLGLLFPNWPKPRAQIDPLPTLR